MCVCVCVCVCVSESRPRLQYRLHHNRTLTLGESVTLTCSVTYPGQLKVTLTLTEDSRPINVSSPLPVGQDTFTVSATIPTRRPRLGPFQCLAIFTQPDHTSAELAHNSAQLRSNVVPALQIACTFMLRDAYFCILSIVTVVSCK